MNTATSRELARQLAAIREAVAELRRQENISMWAQGESPRPSDYSEGHYTGVRVGILRACDAIDAALASGDDS